jgi:hypothetical protein
VQAPHVKSRGSALDDVVSQVRPGCRAHLNSHVGDVANGGSSVTKKDNSARPSRSILELSIPNHEGIPVMGAQENKQMAEEAYRAFGQGDAAGAMQKSVAVVAAFG